MINSKTKASQNADLIEYLIKHPKGITSWEAAEKLGIMRLSARVADLRERGHEIKTVMITGYNHRGHVVNYANYILEKENV